MERYKVAKANYDEVFKALFNMSKAILTEEMRASKAENPKAQPGALIASEDPFAPMSVPTGEPGEVLEIDEKYRFQFLKDKIVMSRPGKDPADPGAYAKGEDGAWPTLGGGWSISPSGARYICGLDTGNARLWLVVGNVIWPLDYGGPRGIVSHGRGGACVFSVAEAGGSPLAGMPDAVRDVLDLPRHTGLILAKPGDLEVRLREWKDPGANFKVGCEKGHITFGRSDGTTLWIRHGVVKLENADDYTMACEEDAKRLWIKDAQGTVMCVEFDPEVRTVGFWKKDDVSGDLGGMPDIVRGA